MPKNIMIVDDSASLRQVVGIALKGAGYDVVEACDGKDALTKMDGRKLHLIISDVNMPNMDGISLLKEIKQHPSYKFTPVIMLTTEAGEGKKS
ncbi:MAG TPA: response regulator, partial [Rhodocyclaceae bacterium]|nr:response regulator [Rhodocyclaceae bacterium]